MSKKQLVKVTLPFGSYNPGEKCGFDPEKAEELLQRNLVCFIDEDGSVTKQNAGQKRQDQLSEALRIDRTAREEDRFMEYTRRFFLDFSSNEASTERVTQLVKDGDDEALAAYALDLGFLGVSLARLTAVMEEKSSVDERNAAEEKAKREAKEAAKPGTDDGATVDEAPKKPARRRRAPPSTES